MNKEIKEILDYIDDRIIPKEKWNKIKDYITNLQEENERLNKDLDTSIEICNNKQKEIVRLNNIINEIENMFDNDILNTYYYGMSYEFEINDFKEDVFNRIKELKEGK